MILTSTLADHIVQKTKELTALHMNVMDSSGMIISSSDPNRIGTHHEGAAKAIHSGADQILTPELSAIMTGTRPGINMPVRFDDIIVGVIGITGDPEIVQPFGKAVQMMTELLLEQAYLSQQVGNEEKARDFLIQDLISGQSLQQLDEVMERARLLGIDLRVPREVWVIQIDQADERNDTLESQRSLSRKIARLFVDSRQILCSRVQRDRWVVIADMQPSFNRDRFDLISSQIRKMISEHMRSNAYLAAGRQVADAASLHQSYKEALTLIKINQLFPQDSTAKHFSDLGLELMCAEITSATRAHMLNRTLRTLPDHPELVKTLDAFFACSLNLAAAAAKLCIHRNTLLYRLDRIQEITGANPKNFAQAAEMHVALLLVRMK